MKQTTSTPTLVEVPPRTCLTIEGHGAPGSADFEEALHALYAVACALKFDLKKRGRPEQFKVGPLEGLWWTGPGTDCPPAPVVGVPPVPAAWNWKLLIGAPEVDDVAVARARAAAVDRAVPRAADVRLERLDEGPCVEVLHAGPYATEGEDLDRMHALMIEAHLRAAGPHHEIYLSDPRRGRPEAIRTILRQPVR